MVLPYRPSTLHRYRQIAEVLTRNGLGFLVEVTGLGRFLDLPARLMGRTPHAERITPPERLRQALEELGPTFVKLGQVLASRPDLLPPAYLAELEKLHDDVSTVPYEQICARIESEPGAPPARLFVRFDPEPLAAASIGQAHAATLKDGTEVVVKVRRPGAMETIEQDLEILHSLAVFASRHWERAKDYDLVGMAQEFAQNLRAELDYLREGHNAERFAQNFADNPHIHIPRVYWETTTARVLTLERIRGLKVNDSAALEAAGIDRPRLAQEATDIFLQMVFEDNFFHADPHPGNLFIMADGRIGLIDFGMVGSLDPHTQELLVQFLVALTGQDTDHLVDIMLQLGAAQGHVDRARSSRDLGGLLAQVHNQPLGQIKIGPVINQTLTIVREHRLVMPSNLSLLLKAVITTEGMGEEIDPHFNLTAAITPHAKKLLMRQYSPRALARRLGQATLALAQLGVDLPAQLRRLLDDMERGNLAVSVRPDGFEPLIRHLERIANRIVLGILTVAFIVGLAVLLAFFPGGGGPWIEAFFVIGFVLSLALGVFLAGSILRSWRG